MLQVCFLVSTRLLFDANLMCTNIALLSLWIVFLMKTILNMFQIHILIISIPRFVSVLDRYHTAENS